MPTGATKDRRANTPVGDGFNREAGVSSTPEAHVRNFEGNAECKGGLNKQMNLSILSWNAGTKSHKQHDRDALQRDQDKRGTTMLHLLGWLTNLFSVVRAPSDQMD